MFTIPKDGTPRHLVEAYRDSNGKPRQRKIAYVYLWPKADIAKLIELYTKYREAMANSKKPNDKEHKTQMFMRRAKSDAAKVRIRIDSFKRAMEIKMAPLRRRVDRRVGPDRRQIFHDPPNPYLDILNFFNRIKLAKLNDILKRIEENKHFGPVRDWPDERKEYVRSNFEPTKILFDKLWTDLQS